MLSCPLRLLAQQGGRPVIGMLGPVSRDDYADRIALIREGLHQSGIGDPHGIPIDYLWQGPERKPWRELAEELVRRGVTVIATGGDPPAHAAKAATRTIPVVFVMGGDPVDQGLVASLSRPGGNLTGASTLNVELSAKRVDVVRELLPGSKHIALLVNSASPTSGVLKRETERAAQLRGLQVTVMGASNDREIEEAFEKLAILRPAALIIGANNLFNVRSRQLAELAARHAIPAIFQTPEFTAAGGLLSYGPNLRELFRMQGTYIGRILRGQNPADLPVQLATRIDMILNLKTAKALGIEVPTAILVRADEVIE